MPAALVIAAACGDDPTGFEGLECIIQSDLIFDGGPGRDAIPALTKTPKSPQPATPTSYRISTASLVS
jgi:hypothetical protein